MSHLTVEVDEDGQPLYMMAQKFAYVDEQACIGCTLCATTSPSTFFMEEEHGRARAFQQGFDAEEVIEEAISVCPVNCITYTSWEDLVALELERQDQVINKYTLTSGDSDASRSNLLWREAQKEQYRVDRETEESLDKKKVRTGIKVI